MSESLADTLISVGVGALLGFLASVGYSTWQSYSDRRGYQTRLAQELELIREQIQDLVTNGKFEAKAFFTEYFTYAKQTLVGKVDAKTWNSVLKAFIAIDQLRFPPTAHKENFNEALDKIDVALKMLR